MTLQRMDHVGIVVDDLAAAIEFFAELGLVLQVFSSLAAGIASSSVALVAFGANSVLDTMASAVLVWRFRHERSGGDSHAVERRAAIAVGVVMTGAGLYLATRAISALAEEHGPESSPFGIALTAAAALVLPVLARVP